MSGLLLLLFGIAVGVLGGLFGIGGGLVLVPGLMLLFGFSQPEAQGTSVAVMIPPIGLFAAIVYYQHGYVRLPVVGWIALGFILGAYLGALLVPHLPIGLLRVAFGILLLYVGFRFILTPGTTHTGSALPTAVATLASISVGLWLKRSQSDKRSLKPPNKDIEYHI